MANSFVPYTDTPLASPGLVPPSPLHSQISFAEEKELLPDEQSIPYVRPRSSRKKWIIALVALVVLAAVGAGVGAAVSNGNKKSNNNEKQAEGTTTNDSNDANAPSTPTSDAPVRIQGTFEYGRDVMRGVNLGSWLLLEPWLFPRFITMEGGATDEYHISLNLGREVATRVLEEHWNNYLNETDFELMAQWGLNHVRIPIGYWAWDISAGEPYVQGQLPYLYRAIKWAAKHNIRVMMDLHGVPGSQNGLDNSGQLGSGAQWHRNPTNVARSLAIIANMTAEFTKEEYGGAVTSIQLLNEPMLQINADMIPVYRQFLNDGYEAIRNPPGLPTTDYQVAVHDGFLNLPYWADFWPKETHTSTVFDTHPYFLYSTEQHTWTVDQLIEAQCNLRANFTDSRQHYTTIAGEFSPALTNCAGYVLGLDTNSEPRPYCATSSGPATTFSPTMIADMRRHMEAQMRVFGEAGNGWFLWTWKTQEGISEEWSYMKGVEHGWIPSDMASPYMYPDPCA